ncbi:helix-turn-helix domain-containing protein [Psychrobacter sp. AOP3-A1-26]|uniref:helix-turn-helix domain-containing protein n=1 Tax=Psychrobacter sp. AOP3-A1-26 TaxID=3457700 RepID=UPI0040367667
MTKDKRIIAFGTRVCEVRKAKGISQEKLAELADINCSYMGNIERGEKNVTLKKVYEICDALNVTIDELVCS